MWTPPAGALPGPAVTTTGAQTLRQHPSKFAPPPERAQHGDAFGHDQAPSLVQKHELTQLGCLKGRTKKQGTKK